MESYMVCFISLFVAVDAIGALPLFLGLTSQHPQEIVNRILWQSLATALLVAVGFLFLGESLLRFVSVTSADFMIAGGVLLFGLSVSDLLVGQKIQRRLTPDSLGAVPIGVPLIVGPAVLATVLLLSHRYGYTPTMVGVLANVGIAVGLFRAGVLLDRVIGKTGMQVLSKVAGLILAAFAVRIIREGIFLIQK